MSTNQGPEYFAAEKKYLNATTVQEKITALEEMIKGFKKHKGSENMLAEIKRRLIRLQEKKEKTKSVGKTTKKALKKEGFQCVIIGFPNTGKSSLLAKLTNARPLINEYPFSTIQPEVGSLDYQGVKSQIVDLPSIGAETFDIGIVNTADLILIALSSLDQIQKIEPLLNKTIGKRLYLFTKSDLLSDEEKRKLEAQIRSKKINCILISTITEENLPLLKEKIFLSMNSIRVYTKEPGKSPAPQPVVLPLGSTVRDVAESILKGFSLKVKETRLTGPSSKFSNQKVGLSHILKDKDIVEFKTN